MGAKRSAQMTEALRLVLKEGKTQAEAARAAGVTAGAMSQTPEMRAFRAAQQGANDEKAVR